MSTKKTLYVIRHAKSSWKDLTLADWERPLNKRGKRDLPIMGNYLRSKGISIDHFISSHAVRARLTAECMASYLSFPLEKIVINQQYYHASPDELVQELKTIPSKFNSTAIFGHNPGLTALINQITDAGLANLPTCGVAAIALSIAQWDEIPMVQGTLSFLIAPKTLPYQ